MADNKKIVFRDFKQIDLKSDLLKVQDILESRSTTRLYGILNTVKMLINLKDINNGAGAQFLTYKGILDHSAFILAYDYVYSNMYEIEILLSPPLNMSNDLGQIFIENLLELNLQKTVLILGEKDYLHLIDEFISRKNVSCRKQPVYEFRNSIERLKKIKENRVHQHQDHVVIITKELQPDDSKSILQNWKYAAQGQDNEKCKSYIKKCISNFPSCGVFIRNKNAETEELVCWVTMYSFGYCGMLHTKESHRGNGYAQLAMNYLSEKMFEQDLTPITGVESENLASIKLMEKIGWTNSIPFEAYFTVI